MRNGSLAFSRAKYGQTADAPYAMWHDKSCASLISPDTLCVAKATSDLEVETTYEDEVYDLQFGQYFGRGNTRVAPPWEFEED